MKESLQNNLIEAIKERLPRGENIANMLTDMLFIGKEAAYRRLRGEVSFTLDEMAIIARSLNISIDEVLGMTDPRSKPFQLKMTRHVNLHERDYAQMEEFVNVLHDSRSCSYREYGASASLFPHSLYVVKCPYISKFYKLRWLYQWDGLDSVKCLNDIKISDRHADLEKRYLEECMHIDYSYYVWDSFVFFYLVNDIKCFSDVSFISKEDVIALKEDLLRMVDNMEDLATKGKYDTGAKVDFYLSSVNFESTYSYLEADNFYLSLILAFTLNGTASLDKAVFDRLKKWIGSLKRLSTLISESGEMQRFKFFKEQRDIINTL